MASVPHAQAFDLCGDEPADLPRQRGRSAGERGVRSDRRADSLARMVEAEIVPRLLLLHPRSDPVEDGGLTPELVDKFALYSVAASSDSLLAVVGGLLQQGVSIRSICLDLLAPAAKRVGEYWDDDRVSYVDVTIALGRMQQVLRELNSHGDYATELAHGDRSALFAPAPGEQHTFGLVIIEEFFRRAGWRTWTELSGDPEEVGAAVASRPFTLFGLTASSVEWLDQIRPIIDTVRKTSRNRDIAILVGGRLFLERPELVASVGADGMAVDARDALIKVEGVVRKLTRR